MKKFIQKIATYSLSALLLVPFTACQEDDAENSGTTENVTEGVCSATLQGVQQVPFAEADSTDVRD